MLTPVSRGVLGEASPRRVRPTAWWTHSRAWLRATARILIVEDDVSVAKRIGADLEREGYGVIVAGAAAEMRRVLDALAIDLVIVDEMLPDEDGWSVLRWLQSRAIPAIILTDKGDAVDEASSGRRGIDVRIREPLDPRNLLNPRRKIRWRAARMPVEADAKPIRCGDWRLDVRSSQLTSSTGTVVRLTRSELRIMLLLTRNPHRLVTRDQLMHLIAGREWKPLDHRIITHMRNLRRKLDLDAERPSLIRTLHGAGYMFAPSRESVAASRQSPLRARVGKGCSAPGL
jgi:DNA-binding response OmpR family regulator